MYNPFITLPDGTPVKYCHSPEPLYATEDGLHIYFFLPLIGVCRELPQRLLKPAPGTRNYNRKQQYKVVTAPKNTYLVHLLVASAWHGPHHYPDFECHHLNGITTDNRPENLIWLSPEDHRHYDARQKALRELLGNLHIFERSDFDRWHAMPEPDFQAMLTGFLHDSRTTDEIMQYEMSHHMEC